jgi:hypothetical protein
VVKAAQCGVHTKRLLNLVTEQSSVMDVMDEKGSPIVEFSAIKAGIKFEYTKNMLNNNHIITCFFMRFMFNIAVRSVYIIL